MEEDKNFASYLESYTKKVQVLNSKINGENNEEFDYGEKDLIGEIYDGYVKRLKSEM